MLMKLELPMEVSSTESGTNQRRSFLSMGVPEVRQHVFWVAVDNKYCALSKQLEV